MTPLQLGVSARESDSTMFGASGRKLRMGARSKIGGFVRWLLTWPVLVILALNIENATSEAGYATVVNQHWKDASPVLNEIYGFVTEPWVLYAGLICWGAVLYEWILYTSGRAEKPGSGYQRWLITNFAESHAGAFFKKGFTRKQTTPEILGKYSTKLAQFGLPQVPIDFEGGERMNAIYGSYILLLGKGQFDLARSFVVAAIQDLECEPQSPEGTGPETQP